MARVLKVVFLVFLLAASPIVTDAQLLEIAGAVAGGAAMFFGAPIALTAAGFSGAGIVAGSVGAKLMSIAATTGHGAAAVGVLQSAGAAGVGAATVAAGSMAGAGVAHSAKHLKDDKKH